VCRFTWPLGREERFVTTHAWGTRRAEQVTQQRHTLELTAAGDGGTADVVNQALDVVPVNVDTPALSTRVLQSDCHTQRARAYSAQGVAAEGRGAIDNVPGLPVPVRGASVIPPAVVATNLPVERLVQRHVSPQLLGLLRVEPHAGTGTFNVSRRLDFARKLAFHLQRT
jgi:hypothetical protein